MIGEYCRMLKTIKVQGCNHVSGKSLSRLRIQRIIMDRPTHPPHLRNQLMQNWPRTQVWSLHIHHRITEVIWPIIFSPLVCHVKLLIRAITLNLSSSLVLPSFCVYGHKYNLNIYLLSKTVIGLVIWWTDMSQRNPPESYITIFSVRLTFPIVIFINGILSSTKC